MTISRSEIIRIVGELESIRVLSDAELLDVLGDASLDAPVDVWRFTCPVCWLVAGEIFYRPVAGLVPVLCSECEGLYWLDRARGSLFDSRRRQSVLRAACVPHPAWVASRGARRDLPIQRERAPL